MTELKKVIAVVDPREDKSKAESRFRETKTSTSTSFLETRATGLYFTSLGDSLLSPSSNGEAKIEKAVRFSELGNHARGTCLREKDGTFDEKHKVEGCAPNKIFHSPVKLRGAALSELVMMKAIQEGGAIAVQFATTESFMNFDGKGVWDMKEGDTFDGNHVILFFGWGEEDGKKFWWGTFQF